MFIFEFIVRLHNPGRRLSSIDDLPPRRLRDELASLGSAKATPVLVARANLRQNSHEPKQLTISL